MGLREKLNENPAITTAVAAGIILLALIYIGWSLLPGGGATASADDEQFWYTTDNGQSWEPGTYFDIYEPGDDGQEQVRVYLFKWEEDGEPFIGWMERMTDDAKKTYREMQSAGEGGDPMMMMGPEDMEMTGKLVAKPPANPGDNVRWVPAMSEQGMEIAQPPTRNGERAIAVYPGD